MQDFVIKKEEGVHNARQFLTGKNRVKVFYSLIFHLFPVKKERKNLGQATKGPLISLYDATTIFGHHAASILL